MNKFLKTRLGQLLGLSLLAMALMAVMVFSASGQSTAAFRQALPGYRFAFPGDHAAHPEFKTEWWYYTGHLTTEVGRRYGYELTFFRSALADQPAAAGTEAERRVIYPAHFAISDETDRRFVFGEKLNRGGMGLAGAQEKVYSVWNELWFAEQLGQQHLLRAQDGDYALHLTLNPLKPPVIHGVNGVSQKSSCVGCASHYYSLTRLATEGVLYVNGQPQRVTGISWMDHEFGSNQLTTNQVGWDWFSIQLTNGEELMLYLLRDAQGRPDPNSSGTWVERSGQSQHLLLKDFTVTPTGQWKSPGSGATYPMGWEIAVPGRQTRLTLTPAFENQELRTGQSTGVTYWEGSVHVSGTTQGQPVQGDGYVEMTGYAQAFRQKI